MNPVKKLLLKIKGLFSCFNTRVKIDEKTNEVNIDINGDGLVDVKF